MSNVVLYIATSLDGKIARTNDQLDWLFEVVGQGDNGYADFFQTVGAVIMGRKTYEEVLRLEDNHYPYANIPNYILTRSPDREAEHVTFTDEPIEQLIERLKQDIDGDIWLVGGGEIIKAAMAHDLIDSYEIAIAPVVLGEGISLFPEGTKEKKLKLTSQRASGQFVMVTYEKA
ncbi:dihydrofolate reductase family protein [Exiguobacterium alkaliphilum]|uniref:Dihydrofolate reductase family protein n=1 Tax=Exiguobacterium alkaliphilum TaxID=1428684 RepID=A0ABT2L1M3_9BACL|nr:dihydrofolate reductase family protein [Exiguobacterium alkaliphilum]MCT4796625.1 dihydrofolate reductase family protein [Exiguobacterium alkaliphilum]